MWSGVISSDDSGEGGAAEDVEAAVVAGCVRPQQLGLAEGRLVAHHVGDGQLGFEVQVGRDTAELQRQVDEDDPIGLALRGDHSQVRGDRRRPDTTLWAVDGDRPPRARQRESVGRHDGSEILRPLEAEQQRLDPCLDLALVEWPADDVVGAGLELMRSSTSSVAATHKIGIAVIDGVERISRHSSNPVLPPFDRPTSMTASWCSATLANASSGSVVRVTV